MDRVGLEALQLWRVVGVQDRHDKRLAVAVTGAVGGREGQLQGAVDGRRVEVARRGPQRPGSLRLTGNRRRSRGQQLHELEPIGHALDLQAQALERLDEQVDVLEHDIQPRRLVLSELIGGSAHEGRRVLGVDDGDEELLPDRVRDPVVELEDHLVFTYVAIEGGPDQRRRPIVILGERQPLRFGQSLNRQGRLGVQDIDVVDLDRVAVFAVLIHREGRERREDWRVVRVLDDDRERLFVEVVGAINHRQRDHVLAHIRVSGHPVEKRRAVIVVFQAQPTGQTNRRREVERVAHVDVLCCHQILVLRVLGGFGHAFAGEGRRVVGVDHVESEVLWRGSPVLVFGED